MITDKKSVSQADTVSVCISTPDEDNYAYIMYVQ